VMKPDGSWRPCGDYRRLNLVTTKDSYPLPNMANFAKRLEGCVIFSKVDLRKGYHQIRMHAADIPKTAIITPFGLWEFLRMTFGLRNAGSTFQRYMDRVLSGLDFIFVYLDDVIIASHSEEEHLQHLGILFQRLSDASLVMKNVSSEWQLWSSLVIMRRQPAHRRRLRTWRPFSDIRDPPQ
jgi:hypothetical protein